MTPSNPRSKPSSKKSSKPAGKKQAKASSKKSSKSSSKTGAKSAPKASSARRAKKAVSPTHSEAALEALIFRFRITLLGLDPPVWREIEVPATYTFWDLHVAIQDVMGWLDYHLHVFEVRAPGVRREIEIGLPDPDLEFDPKVRAGWEVSLVPFFIASKRPALYIYDFGDGWEHEIRFLGLDERPLRTSYPRCTGGARACPPEDCGGPGGYEELLEALADPRHERHLELSEWIPEGFDPEHFDASEIQFDDPKIRLKALFEDLEHGFL
jgi:hypothetical protein